MREAVAESVPAAVDARMKAHRKRPDAEDRLTTVFYILMRDHLPFGTVELLMQQHVEKSADTSIYCNGLLARYAEELAQRVLRPKRARKRT